MCVTRDLIIGDTVADTAMIWSANFWKFRRQPAFEIECNFKVDKPRRIYQRWNSKFAQYSTCTVHTLISAETSLFLIYPWLSGMTDTDWQRRADHENLNIERGMCSVRMEYTGKISKGN